MKKRYAWAKRGLPEHGKPMPAHPIIIYGEYPAFNPLSIRRLKRHVSKHQSEGRCKVHVWWSLSPWRKMQVVKRATGTQATATSKVCTEVEELTREADKCDDGDDDNNIDNKLIIKQGLQELKAVTVTIGCLLTSQPRLFSFAGRKYQMLTFLTSLMVRHGHVTQSWPMR
ncbi:unnamed protein product [Nyctereutes procyonoides]|uniref:(raccoon dog) hypothetical protein n=1 Tax=Nyctereutes procyonoides TaxID=34880 RepID=A0A811ZGE6_NYCPR|nr:unnamed protein product [Nyctereutes procyonoides]